MTRHSRGPRRGIGYREARAHALIAAAALWVWVIGGTFAGSGYRNAAGQLVGGDFIQFYTLGDAAVRGEYPPLAAADAHERRFPNGALAEERELLRIEALFRLDRDREARARAAALTASRAGRAYQVQVQRLIARYTGGTQPDVKP